MASPSSLTPGVPPSSSSSLRSTPGVPPSSSSPTSSSSPSSSPPSSSSPGSTPGNLSSSVTSTHATTTKSSSSSVVPSTSHSSSAPVQSLPAPSYGGGAVAGIAIGTAIAGALLAGLVVFFLMSRKLKKRQSRSGGLDDTKLRRSPLHNQSMPSDGVPRFETPTTTMTVATKADSIHLTDYLRQPPAEETLINDASRLFTIVEGHADNYYHTMAVAEPKTVPQLLDLEDKRFHLATLRSHLANPRTRAIAIRRLILTMIIAGISSPGDTRRSFLPKELANLVGLISTNQDNSSASRMMFSQWRVLTASQLDLQQVTNHTKAIIAQMVADLNTLLNPYILHEKRQAQETQLIEVMRRAARLGVSLFTDPAIWEFQWPADGRGFGVSPAFVKICDESGRFLDPHVVGLESESVRV